MTRPRLVIHESEGETAPDICGTVVEMINTETAGSTKLSFAKLIIRPGEKSRQHFHLRTEEVYYILSGSGKIIIDGESYPVRQGHSIFLPVGARHQILNTTDQDLIFVCADAPVFYVNGVLEG